MLKETPNWVYQNHEWQATLHIFDNSSLSWKNCRKYIDFDDKIINFPQILEDAGSWSNSEKLLARIAMDFYNRGGNAVLGDILRILDKDNVEVVLEAVQIFCGLE